MFPRTRLMPSEPCSLWGHDAAHPTVRRRDVRSWRRLTASLALWVWIGLSAGMAAPRGGVRPGYDSFDDASSRQAQVETDYRETWHAFKTTTQDLIRPLGAANADAALLLTQIQTNAAFLDAKWRAWINTHPASTQYAMHDDYLAALHGDLRALRKLKKEKDLPASLEALREIALDLQIKADNCRNSSDGLGKEIKVKVHTKADGKEVAGFNVYFAPRGLLDMKSAHDRFPRESSPTDEKILNPGRYALWARKGGFTGKPETLTIGGHGETRLEVDIEVPAD